MQPPRPTVIAHGKLSSHVCPKSAASELNRSAAMPVRSARPNHRPLGVSFPLLPMSYLSWLNRTRHQGLAREISTQDTVAHIAMSLHPTIAWKASPTRTPPPICTSAPFLKPRWSQNRGRRERFRNTRCVAARNDLIRHGSAQTVSNAQRAREEASETRKQVFESARKIVHSNRAVTNCDVLQKKIYKSFKQEPLNRFFQTLHLAMGISDYRNNDFRVSFGRVTPARCS